ncbi:MAG: hypothetical protein DM484_06405 [Candidatus Methylumidiphilus alinenensis]|uniref:Uncharacterized protein n=1 Tax=Candidatus Methylumidiphilus alinenensis TaxID=2202197 RepID=A0A2W4REE6_9GAMM|nr:MAG: hypothetical protein DM484_06405 [Candidatus Methylumidiphilus alinenensis]
MDALMKKLNVLVMILLIAIFGMAFGIGWAAPDDAATDPQYPEFFSKWLYLVVIVSGLVSLASFYILHKKFLPYDAVVPLFVALLSIYALAVLPVQVNKNFFGWFSEDCFKDNVVNEQREANEWAAPKNLRPGECIEARENVEAIGIKFFIRHYQQGVLDYRPLTTGEVKFFYATLLILWTWTLYGLGLLLYKQLVIK